MEHFLWVDNQRSAQSKFVVDHFPKILSEFSTIIELGTFTGVFTKWLSENISDDCNIISYDINPNYREVGELKNVTFRVADILEPSTIFEIKSLVKFGGKVLFLCDGGDKETEFKLYSKFLKNGDVIMLHDYEHTEDEYNEIKNLIGWTTISESHFKNLDRYLYDLHLIPHMYDEFKQVLWGSFIKKTDYDVTLSITTSKRIDLFKKTISSFHENCVDRHLIKTIYHFDDSSNVGDLIDMERTFNHFFPNAKIVKNYFTEKSFKTNKRHCSIMNEWLKVLNPPTDFNFHLEDDWLFNKKFSLMELILFIKDKDEVAYVGVSQYLRDFPKNITPKIDGNFWEWYYDHSKDILSNLFLDTKVMESENTEGFWCHYINWPYFGFRPGLWDVKKLNSIESIDCDCDVHFEINFAKKLTKNYVSYCTIDSVCEHIGINNSSYDLNNSER
jgi:hypothetical protein